MRASHLTTGAPATSNNAYSGGRSSYYPILALESNWQPEDNASYNSTASAQHPLPHPILKDPSDVAVSGHCFTAQPPTELYSAASLPQDYKYHHNDYTSSLLETRTSYFMPETQETMQTPPVSGHPSPNDTAMGEPQSRKRSHSAMSASQDFTQQIIAAATANSASHPNDPRPVSRSASVVSGGGEGEGYSPRGSRAFKRGDPPKNLDGKYICDYTEDCREATFDRKCEWR